jgi:hypothetical protein
VKIQLLLSCLIIFTLNGCVAFPTSRTYFEPNSNDGKITPSVSCGYNRTALDTLEREIDGVKLRVTPYFKENNNFTLLVTFKSHSENNSFTPEDFVLLNLDSGNKYHPQSVNRMMQKPRDNWPYFVYWFNLDCSIRSMDLSKISIQLLNGSVVIDDNKVKIEPFRFNKTTKSDIYYGSINC